MRSISVAKKPMVFEASKNFVVNHEALNHEIFVRKKHAMAGTF